MSAPSVLEVLARRWWLILIVTAGLLSQAESRNIHGNPGYDSRHVVVVPFPGASDQHQLKNAQALENAGAARLVLDHEMNGARLVEEVTRLTQDTGLLEKMGAAAKAFAKPGAAKRAADVLEEFSIDRS